MKFPNVVAEKTVFKAVWSIQVSMAKQSFVYNKRHHYHPSIQSHITIKFQQDLTCSC